MPQRSYGPVTAAEDRSIELSTAAVVVKRSGSRGQVSCLAQPATTDCSTLVNSAVHPPGSLNRVPTSGIKAGDR